MCYIFGPQECYVNSNQGLVQAIKMLNEMSPNVNDTLFVFYGILIPVIAVFGFVGNGLVLYILIR